MTSRSLPPRIAILGFAVSLVFASPLMAQQDCSKCDCNHFPIASECYKCCGFATGTIASLSSSTLGLSVKNASGKTGTKTFSTAALPPTNRLKKGAQVTVYYQKNGNLAKRIDLTESLQGLLVPDDETSPPDPCPPFQVPENALKLFLGSSLVFTTGDEMTVFQGRGTDLLSIRRTPKGIALEATIFSEDGSLAASIVDNHFFINPDGYFGIQKPDPHTLIVRSKTGEDLVRLRYLNSTTVRLTGKFYTPAGGPIVVTEDELRFSGFISQHSCFGNNQVAFKIK